MKIRQLTHVQIIALGFFLVIACGTALLMLPVASKDGESAGFITAMFTAVSCSCVTGLALADTWTQWTFFGQGVMLTLIQIGGLGFMTIATLFFRLMRRRMSMRERAVMAESISVGGRVARIMEISSTVVIGTLIFEGTGAILLAIRFIPQYGAGLGTWFAVFHSVSAFCNAGFDLMGMEAGTPFVSLTGYAGDPLVTLTVAGLIALGGIGFITWGDVRTHKWHLRSYCLQTKLVLTVTALLILLPTLFFLFYEFRLPQWQSLTPGEKVLGALFQSVTPRTAGYNTVDLTLLSEPSQLIITMLMLIGASPGSTAGGFKVTTLAVFFLAAKAVFRRKESLQSFGRRLPMETLRSAAAIFLMYLVLFFLGEIGRAHV